MLNSCWGHCLRCTGSGGSSSREPRVVGVLVVPGAVARTTIDVVAGPGGCWDAAKDSGPGPATAQAGSGEVSPDAVAGGEQQQVAGGVDEPGAAANVAGVGDGEWAVASPVPSGGDARRGARQYLRSVDMVA